MMAADTTARSGDISRASHRICVISVAQSEPTADTKYQLGGFSRASRLSFSESHAIYVANAAITATFATFQ